MNRDRSYQESTGLEKAKRSLLLFLLGLFLVTTCPIKKSINLMLFDNAGIENFGLNDQKTGSENGSRILTGSGACSILDRATPATADLHSPKIPLPLFPISLAFLFLLPAGDLKALFRPGSANYFEKSAFPVPIAPIYIRNRRLLI